jgi:hypothetical protein
LLPKQSLLQFAQVLGDFLGAGLNPHPGNFYSNQKLSANRVFVKDGWFEIRKWKKAEFEKTKGRE